MGLGVVLRDETCSAVGYLAITRGGSACLAGSDSLATSAVLDRRGGGD